MVKKIARSFMGAELVVPLPHLAAVVLACAAGAAQVVNQTLVNVPGAWHAYIGLGIAAVALEGVKPLVGDQFRTVLHLPAWASQAITLLVGVATVVGGQINAAPGWVQPALAALVTVLLGLGFGPASSPLAEAAQRRRVVKRREAAAALLGETPPARKR